MPTVYWFRFPKRAVADRSLSVLALGVLAHLLDWCDTHLSNHISKAALRRLQLGSASTIRRLYFVSAITMLRQHEFLHGGMEKGVTLLCYPGPVHQNPIERKKEIQKPSVGSQRGERRAGTSVPVNGNGGDGNREQRPESKALWKLVKHWGPLPSHMCSLTAEASETTVAYALDIQRNGAVREQWQYLWACVHPQKTKENPEGKRKPPPDAALRKAKKRIDAEREIPGPLGAAAAALAKQMGKGQI